MTMEPPVVRRQMLDRYEILTEIASGGMATVYLGRLSTAPGVERLVAIKKLHPHLERQREFVEMFLDEARIAAKLHHPNVVATLEFGANPQGHFLVMDYVEGPTLAKMLAKAALDGGPLPQPVALRIVLDALSGLQVAHELTGDDGRLLDVVHRDVSPQNLLIDVSGVAKITDFGVARATERLAVTRTGQLKGKLSYMAPEQARGEPTDRRADVFAMGIILWECLAGRRLFRGRTDTEAETLSRVLYGDIPRISTVLPDIHPALDVICARALERSLDARFASCAEFIEALEQAGRQGLTIGYSRDVARYLEQAHGADLAQRRSELRQLPTFLDRTPAPGHEDATATEAPHQLSSVSSAALSIPASGSYPRYTPTPVPPAPPPPRSQGILLGALGATLVVASAAIGTLVWVVSRTPTVVPTPAVAASSAAATSAPPTAPPATTSAPAPASASASAQPSAPALRPTGAPSLGPWKKPADGLSTNPYRR